jgi:glutathione S-transferase
MITLYGFGRVHRKVIGETRDLRVQWALEETGLPYRVRGLDHTGGELDGPAEPALRWLLRPHKRCEREHPSMGPLQQ